MPSGNHKGSDEASVSRDDDIEAALSAEQIRIIELLAEDWTDLRIANHLGLSERTVRRRIRAAASALGVSSRLQLVVRATNRGLLSVSKRDVAASGHDD